MRALRTHPSKPDNVGRFVQAVGIDHWISSDADLRKFVTELASMKVLAELKSYPAESQRPGFGRGRLSTWFRHLGEPRGEFQNREVTCGELDSLVNLRVFDRSGYCIDTRDDPCWLLKLRLKELRQWQESRGGGWPQTDSEDQDERQLAKWFKTLAKRAAKGNISTEERGLLQGTGLKLKPSVVDKMRSRAGTSRSGDPRPWVLNLTEWVTRHQQIPSQYASEREEKLQGKKLVRLGMQYRRGQLTPRELAEVNSVSEMKQIVERWNGTYIRPWLQDLLRWFKAHSTSPSSSQDETKKLQLGRVRRLAELYCRGELTSAEEELVAAETALDLHRKKWDLLRERSRPGQRAAKKSTIENIREILAWVTKHRRQPKLVSRSVPEQRLAYNLEKLWQEHTQGKMSQEESCLLQSTRIRLKRIQEILAWVEIHKRRPTQYASDSTERGLAKTLWKSSKLEGQGGLKEDESSLLREVDRISESSSRAKTAAKLHEVLAWVETHKRRPTQHASDGTERGFAYSLRRLVKLEAQGKPSAKKMVKLQEVLAWVEVHKRRPLQSASDITERRLSYSFQNLVADDNRGDLEDNESSLLNRIRSIAKSSPPATKAAPLDVKLRELLAWVESHKRHPAWHAPDITERRLAWSLGKLARLENRGDLKDDEASLLQKVRSIAQSNPSAGKVAKLHELLAWVKVRKRRPARHASDVTERRLAYSLENLVSLGNRGDLTHEESKVLQRIRSTAKSN
eukprot:TRINITY_DN12529_c0_g1_i3.p1 TRINITY_DN12529_c0_g1~~TRINITY_DN12529_c0_g1_i3.p1  ORF type:complete len:766 (-),score=129.12 TRINITY_DN12529_c0_g1_i3:528-2747(-)